MSRNLGLPCLVAYAGMRKPPACRELPGPQDYAMKESKRGRSRPKHSGATGAIDGGAADGAAAVPGGSTDQSIGRPGNWREGRYQRSGARVDQAVNQPSQTDDAPHDTVGTQTPPASPRANRPKSPPPEQQKPVTLRDYES